MAPKSSKTKTSLKSRRDETQTRVSAESLPRRNLETALRVCHALRENYAGKNATWEEIARALKVSAKDPKNKYPLWSAVAYGIVLKNEDGTYSLAEAGRKILAQTYEGERDEGIKKALFTPSVLSRFYTDYNGAALPSGEMLGNVLESRYGVPRERLKEAIEIILSNARFAGAVINQDGKEAIRFSDVAFPVASSAPPPESDSLPKSEASPTSSELDKSCFVITPIGADDSLERKHADAILRHLIEPVLASHGIKAIRADQIAKPGIITKQIIEHIAFCRLCIADLSFGNPNAFYELGVRHAFKLSTIQIIKKGDKIPFDVSQGRTIIIDTSDPYTIMDRFEAAKSELSEHVGSALKGAEKAEDNPIALFLPKLQVILPR